ncbi:MAG: hypothetical protein LBL34_02150, partial [Clostridiales bacterium]|nr:hypothetical protein [Clostridiales bacterium]
MKKALAVIGILALFAFAIIVSYNLGKNSFDTPFESSNESPIGEDVSDSYIALRRSELSEHRSFSVPYIRMNSNDAQRINEEIEAFASFGHDYINYEAYLNGNVLSLVIIGRNIFYQSEDYAVYNIDVKNGQRISNETLIQLRGISQSDFLEKAKNSLEQEVNEWFNTVKLYGSANSTQEIHTYLNDNLKKITMDCPIFMDEEGNIKMVVLVATPTAGSGGYTAI